MLKIFQISDISMIMIPYSEPDADFCLWETDSSPGLSSFISVLVLTWAGNDCDYLGWAETAESVFKSEPELRSGNNKNWCDLVTGHGDGDGDHDWAGDNGSRPVSILWKTLNTRVSHSQAKQI